MDPTRRQISQQLSNEGKTKHRNMVEENERLWRESIENKNAEYKKQLEDNGWEAKEIELLSEAWVLRTVKDKDSYQQDKKDAKRLTKEAEALRAKRTK
tara:strand:+ start:830 stop:1123 length:294 start_codon:yes stop_codon:yes gene_type:complete